MSKISITRALTEVKTLGERIATLTNSMRFCYLTKGLGDKRTVPNTNLTVEAASLEIVRRGQQLTDLMLRRAAIKAAIQRSNAVTSVTINGQTMLVADAIERKNSVIFQTNIIGAAEHQLRQAIATCEAQNVKLDQQIEQAVSNAYGNDKGKVTEEQYAAVANPRRADHLYSILDPLDLNTVLQNMRDEVQGFISEVDFVLSESNARTEIEVEISISAS